MLSSPFDFSNPYLSEKIIKKTWNKFRLALKNKEFEYNETSKALTTTFLNVFDQIFESCASKVECSLESIQEHNYLKRGAKLKEDEAVCYDRFMPKAIYIKDDNRFSPAGVEWLYLAISPDINLAEKCTIKECRAQVGDRFGICSFVVENAYKNSKIVDLTLADNLTYEKINSKLVEAYKWVRDNRIDRSLIQHCVSEPTKEENDFIYDSVLDWALQTYLKLLSDQIFVPLSDIDDKTIMYAPFQCVAQYFLNKGYMGIKYKSTVYESGQNIVLFNKSIVKPTGDIKEIYISI